MEKYKITKTIRFRLDADNTAISAIVKDTEALEARGQGFKIKKFVNALGRFLSGDGVQKYLYDMSNEENCVFKRNLVIKNTWLKNNAKQEIAGMDLKRGLIIKDIKGLQDKIEEIYDKLWEIYEILYESAYLPLQDLARREGIGLLLKKLSVKNALPFIISFVEESNDKNEADDLSLRLKKQGKEILTQLEIGINEYLPAQSSGLPVAKASFNYYTINKTPVDFGEKIQELEKRLSVDIKKEISSFTGGIKTAIKNKIAGKKILLGDTPMFESENSVSLRQILKNIKSEQKAQFNKFMTTQNNPQLEEMKTMGWYLFGDITEGEFNDYKEQTKEIERVGAKINQCGNIKEKKELRSQLQKLKKKRGELISEAHKKGGNDKNFKTYKEFAKFYRKIAQRHGKILAQIKGIEKEKIDSAMLNYWAAVIELSGRHKLVLIPKKDENAKKCIEWLEDESKHKNGSCKIFWFESFTFRSLQKLCFGNLDSGTNTFNQKIQNLLPCDERGNLMNGEFAFKGDEQEKIKFYKKVLQSQKDINLPQKEVVDNVVGRKFETMDEFKIALEEICYIRRERLSANAESELKSKFNAQIFDITSLDLRNPVNCAGKPEVYHHNDKRHTEIWKEFWSLDNERRNFNIRLNPEITITYRKPKESRILKYGKGTEKYNADMKNRYLYPQYTLLTTISEHCNTPTKILSFMTDNEYEESIKAFNSKLKKEDIKFAFGIDSGETELSTLGVYLPEFSAESTELKDIEKYGFNVLTIKDLNYTETDYNGSDKKIVKNPSYFVDKSLYMRTFKKTEQEYEKMFAEQFEAKKRLSLDLSAAKVICGHIVTNGGVSEHFGLWLKHAQRTIFWMNDHTEKKTAKNIKLKDSSELTYDEREKFAEHISSDEKFKKLDVEEKKRYVRWIFEDRETLNFTEAENKKFGGYQKKKGDYRLGILFASCFIGKELESVTQILDCRHIFKKREEFYSLKSKEDIEAEIKRYNTDYTNHNISTEQLDLKFVNVKNALVANAVGVIDLLYKQYKERLGGEGLIAKEGFDTKKVEEDMEKFSGNIYRILERKLYQKFQNYGLVPPIKNLMAVRADKVEISEAEKSKIRENCKISKIDPENEIIKRNKTLILRLGSIAFVNDADTSQECPACGTKSKEKHVDNFICGCGFNSTGIIHSNDGVAGFNIAKRGFVNLMEHELR